MPFKFRTLLASISVWTAIASPAALGADVNDLSYTETATEVTITDCDTNAAGTLNIPATINGKPVTAIGYAAFQDCSDLTEVTIPRGVTSIGNFAFANASSLTAVYFLGSAPTVESSSFLNVGAGAKAIVFSSKLATYGSGVAGHYWRYLILEERADPVLIVRFTGPKKNSKVGRKMTTRYRVTNPEWASMVEVMVRGRGKTTWMSFDEVKATHKLVRKIKDSPATRLLNTAERARIRNLDEKVVQVATLKLKSKFPWKSRKAKVKVLKAL